MFCDGAGACLASTDLCCGVVCDPNACLVCQGGICVTTCPSGTHCDGSGNCVSDCVPGGTCSVDGDCCGDNLCCAGICVTPGSPCGQCISGCNNDSSKCCCFNSNGTTYTCATRGEPGKPNQGCCDPDINDCAGQQQICQN
jgi:hypothetical protein